MGATFAARRARNAAWLYVYRELFDLVWWRTSDPANIPRISHQRLYRKQVKRGLRYIYPRTDHTLHKLAGLARVCQRRGVRSAVPLSDVPPLRRRE